jgi:hypothetical protein
MYISNSELVYNSNRYYFLFLYFTSRKVVPIKSLLLIYKHVVLHYQKPLTNDKNL